MATRTRVLWLAAAFALGAAAGVVYALALSPGTSAARVVLISAATLSVAAVLLLLVMLPRRDDRADTRRAADRAGPPPVSPAGPDGPPGADRPAPPDRVAATLELVRLAIAADGVALLLPAAPAPAGPRLRVSAWAPADAPGRRESPFPAASGLPGAVLRTGTAQAAVGGDGLLSVCTWTTAERAVAHALGAPVAVAGGEGVRGEGVLVADRRADPAFPPEALERLRRAAGLVAWVVAADRDVSRALDRVAALQALEEAAHGLAAADDAADVARRTIGAARALVPATVAVVALRDGAPGRPAAAAGPAGARAPSGTLCVAAGWGPAPAEGEAFPADAGLAGQAVELREILPVAGRPWEAAGPVLGAASGWAPAAGGALAVVPLLGGEEAVGVLVVAAGTAPPYDDAQRLLLRSLANLAGAELVRRRLERSLSALARTDPLTSLANRRAFDESLAAALRRSERYGHPTSLLLLDLDHFKRVNDRHGHATGDLVLQGVAQILRKAARGVDVPARLGGEELAVILEHTDTEGARQVAERIRESLERVPFPCADGTFRVTVSVGVAGRPPNGSDPARLLAAADAALYAAKAEGRNRVVVQRP